MDSSEAQSSTSSGMNLQQPDSSLNMSVDSTPNRNLNADQSSEDNLDWQSEIRPRASVARSGAGLSQPRNLTSAFENYPPVMLSDSTALQVYGETSGRLNDSSDEVPEVVPPNPGSMLTRSMLETISNLRRSLSTYPLGPQPVFSTDGIMMRTSPFAPVIQTDQFLHQLSSGIDLGQNWNQWQSKVMEWLRFTASELERIQQKENQFEIQSQDLNETIMRLVVCVGELKNWSDGNISKVWGKLGETWNSLRDYCFQICQQQNQHQQVIQGVLQDLKSVHQATCSVSQIQIPEVVSSVNQEFEKLNAKCGSAFHEAQGQMEHLKKLVSEVAGCVSTQATVVQGLSERLESVVSHHGSGPTLPEMAEHLRRLEHLYRQLNGKYGGLHLNHLVHQVNGMEETVGRLSEQVFTRSSASGLRASESTGESEGVHRLDFQWVHQQVENLQRLYTEQEDQAAHQSEVLNGFANDIADLMQEREELKSELQELRHLIMESHQRPVSDGYAAPYTGIFYGPKPRAPRPGQALGGTNMQTRGNSSRDLEGGVSEFVASEDGLGMQHSGQMASGSFGVPSTPPQPTRGVPQSQTHLQNSLRTSRTYSQAVTGEAHGLHDDLQWRRFNRLRESESRFGSEVHPSPAAPVHLRFGDRESTPHPEHLSSHSNEKFNSSVHQMVAEALKFDSWDGDWLEMEDWFLNWRLYCEAACSGMHGKAKTVLFLSKLPLQYSEFLKVKHLVEGWSDVEMMNWLTREKEMRVPLHQRRTAWENLKPSGNTYQHLTTWFQKWHRRIRDLKVTESQVLDQFDLSVKYHFSAPLTEVLKTEQELKERTDPGAKICLEQRYQMLLKEVSIADNVRALTDHRSGTSTPHGTQRPRTSFSENYRSNWAKRSSVRTMASEKKGSPCYYCKEFGHWIATCPKKKQLNLKHGNCLSCGKPGHLRKDCPTYRSRDNSQSSGVSRNSWTSAKSGSSKVSEKETRHKPQRQVSVKKSSSGRSETKKDQGRRQEKSPRRQGTPQKRFGKTKKARVSEVSVEEGEPESVESESAQE